jgi:methylenetetrahydrofolate reductase (NADPH)
MVSLTTAPAPAQAPEGTIDQIVSFMGDSSLEATRPSAGDVAALGASLKPGTNVYLTMLPNRPLDELVASALAVRNTGLEPVPHLSARHFASMDVLEGHVGRLADEAGVRSVLLIGGDIAKPVGTVETALTVIESGLFQRRGIASVGLPGFPDGHPAMNEDEIEANLVTKLAAVQNAGLEAHIVTQFCFDSRPILAWLNWLGERGIHAPVRIGLAGPTSLMTWLNYARKCGVKASAEALASRSGLVKHAFKAVTPDPIIRALAAAKAAGTIDNVAPHFFAFGGIGATAKWVQAPISGAIRLNKDGGFDPA